MEGYRRERYPTGEESETLERIYREIEKSRLDEMLRASVKAGDERAVERVVVKEKERAHVTALRLEEEELEDLKLKVEEVFGTISERKKFLERRIREIKEAIRKREELHEKILEDIDEEVNEKESLMKKMSKIEDIRDILLDISALKSQKRREEVQFWRDITQLKNELAVLEEEYEVTKNMASILKEE